MNLPEGLRRRQCGAFGARRPQGQCAEHSSLPSNPRALAAMDTRNLGKPELEGWHFLARDPDSSRANSAVSAAQCYTQPYS